MFILLIALANACTDSFDCYTDCKTNTCNGIECPCDLTNLTNSFYMTDNLTMQYELSATNITLIFDVTLCQKFAIVFDYTRYNEKNQSRDEYDVTNKDSLYFFWGTYYQTFYYQDTIGLSSTFIINDEYISNGYQSWQILGYAIINENIRIKITRTITTDDKEDYQFNVTQTNIGYLIVYDNGGPIYRNYDRGVYQIDFAETNSIQKYQRFTDIGHSIFLFIFWGILSDIGVFFGRQLKSYPKYAKVHGMIFLFQGIITYIFAFSKIEYNKIKIQEIYYYDGIIIAHFIVGVIILSLITIQLLLGMIVKNNLESLNGSEKIYRIKKIHHFMGYFLYLVTKAQVAMGMHMERPDLLILFYGFYVLLFFTKISIEILYYYEVSLIPRTRVTYTYIDQDKNQLYNNLIDKINSNVPRNQLVKEYQKLNYIILRDAIYDVSDFNHPGGQYIMERIAGREIGRYFYGGFPIQNLSIKPHRHTLFAINYIETRYLGDYRNDNCPLMYHEENIEATDKQIWRFEQYIKMADDIGMFVFQSHFFQVKQFLKGVQWFGRYFYIKPYGTGLDLSERPYSVVMCYNTTNINRREAILEYFKAQIIEGNDKYFPKMETTILSNDITFIIKKHNFSSNMSRFLHSTGHKPYEITGPYGLGLELDENSDGLHYAFCQGTGVLPFLDLIDFLLRKAIYTILHDQRSKEVAEYINDNNEDYINTLGKDFQLILHGSFSDIDHFCGYPIIQDLLFICKTFNLPYFDMIVRIGDQKVPEELYNCVVNSHFDLQYLKRYVKYKGTKMYVCGSPAFEEEVCQALFDMGIPKKYLVIV